MAAASQLATRADLSAEASAFVEARAWHEPSRAYITILRSLAELKRTRIAAEQGAVDEVFGAVAGAAIALGRPVPDSEARDFNALLTSLIAHSVERGAAAQRGPGRG